MATTLRPEVMDMDSWKPDAAKIYVDVYNQRFIVHHTGLKGSLKSFSWQRRGVHEATACALKQAWAWETNLSGCVCPLPRDLLALAE